METITSAVRNKLLLLRIMPDLSLRATFIIVALCLVVTAFYLGDLHGRSARAEEQLAVTDTLAFVPWDDAMLQRDGAKNTAAVGAAAQNFVASANGKLYYPANCKAAARIKEENRVWFASAPQAQHSGYTPAKNCSGL